MRRPGPLARLAARACAVAAAALALAACAAGPMPDAALRRARFVLLGEIHDNPAHHAERAALLRELLADGRPTRVVFEQMERANDAAIAETLARVRREKLAPAAAADAVASAGGLDRAAWRWPLHEPLVVAAIEGGAAIGGANLGRDALRAVIRGGLGAAPPDLRALLERDRGWTPAQQATLERLIDEGHCGALPAAQRGPMALAQRVRDAAFAEALLDAPPGARAVLIAGDGHVRLDVGVPQLLRAAGVPPDDIVAIGWVEPGGGDAPYDRRVVTPRAERDDPCAALRPGR